MSNVSDKARVSILLAEYAVFDPSNQKTTMLGVGLGIMQGNTLPNLPYDVVNPNQLVMTPPFSVVAAVAVPAEYQGEEYALSLDLRDDSGEVVTIEGPNGAEKMRITQLIQVEAPHIPNVRLPRYAHSARYQVIANFTPGLVLPSNAAYKWTVELDGNPRGDWQADFYLLNPTMLGRGPVIG